MATHRKASWAVGACALGTLLFHGTAGLAGTDPTWIDKSEDESYTARHECSFVQAGARFYLFGGRESAQTLDTYDYLADSWTTSASAPIEFNHFQATEYQGLVWVIGAFKTNSFPTESPADSIYVFDPARNVWMQGPDVPIARRRGSAGLVVYDDRFYVVAGNTIGHDGGYVAWFDEYDPQTGRWTPLTDAPGARDHFHAAVAGDKLYAVGGRLSGGPGGTFAPLIAEVDVYDFAAGSWSRLAAPKNLPTPRAASAVAFYDGEILVIGGEGNGQAYDTVEGFDPITESWTTRASLNYGRHGTQAIVSGQGIYVTAGSPSQGGGRQKNMEVYDTDAPGGVTGVGAVLSAPSAVAVTNQANSTIGLSHIGGNEGAFVTDVVLSGTDAADFSIVSDVADPFLILISGSRELRVAYNGVADGATASLDVTYSGDRTVSTALTGTTQTAAPGAVASLSVGRSGSNLQLTWDADCGSGDAFGIYRGDLALGYVSLAMDSCDLIGTTAIVPMGLPDGEFFLVVPSFGSTEGSYGQDHPCTDRPAAPTTCYPKTATDGCAQACGAKSEIVLRSSRVVDLSADATTFVEIVSEDRDVILSELRARIVNTGPPGSTLDWEAYEYELRLFDGLASAEAAAGSLATAPPDHRELELSVAPEPCRQCTTPGARWQIEIDLSKSGLVVPARARTNVVLGLTIRPRSGGRLVGLPSVERSPGSMTLLGHEVGPP